MAHQASLWYKKAGASESDPTATYNFDGQENACLLFSVRGGDTDFLASNLPTWLELDPSTDGLIQSPTVTTDSVDSMLISIATIDENDTFVVPQGMTLIGSHDYSNMAVAAAYEIIDPTGATGTREWEFPGINNEMTAFSFAIKNKLVLKVETAPSSLTRGGTASIVLSNADTTPTTSNTTLKLNGISGELLTLNSITGSGPYTVNFTVPSDIALQYDNTGYTFYVTVGSETSETETIPFVPHLSQSYIDIDFTLVVVDNDASVYSGDTATTLENAQYEHDKQTSAGLNVIITPEGYVNLSEVPTANQTFDGRVIESNGTIREMLTYTISVESPDIPLSENGISNSVGNPVSDLVSDLAGN
jgi:hypothetical protein